MAIKEGLTRPDYIAERTIGFEAVKRVALACHVRRGASLLRPLGGDLSDRYGPRAVAYSVFGAMTICLIPLSLPVGVLNLGIGGFTLLMMLVGMGIGKASVYKYVPTYYPNDVGAVGGLVGGLGALGGFVLPPAFGALGRWADSPQAAFLALTVGSLMWLHLAVISTRRRDRRYADSTLASSNDSSHQANNWSVVSPRSRPGSNSLTETPAKR